MYKFECEEFDSNPLFICCPDCSYISGYSKLYENKMEKEVRIYNNSKEKSPKYMRFFLNMLPELIMPLQAVGRLGTSLLNTALLQGCWNRLVTTWWSQQLVTRLFQQVWFDLLLTSLLQVVPTTCYKSANQQLVASLLTTSLLQLDKITSLLQIVNKLATSLFRQQLVNKFRPVKCHAFGMIITHFFHMDFVEIFRATLRRSVTRCGNIITTIW